MKTLSIVAALCLPPLTAQEAFQARQFLPNDYHNVVSVDLRAMRANGLWDELDAGVLKMLLGQMEQEAGFPLAALDRVMLVANSPRAERDGQAPQSQQIAIFEGNRELEVPDRVARNRSYKNESIGIYDVRRRQGFGDEVFFRPRPTVHIYGTTSMLRPMLEGRPSAGMPCPDILSLLSGRSEALLYFVVNVGDAAINGRVTEMLFPGSEWPDGDIPQYLMVRLRAVGDPDDPNIAVELVIRHGTDGEGLKVTEQAVAQLLERARKEPQFRLFAPLLEKVVQKKDRTDLTLELDLGAGRTAAGHITMLAMPMLMMGTTVEQAEVVEAIEEPAPEPAKKEPAKKGDGKV